MDVYDYAASRIPAELRSHIAQFWQDFGGEADRLDAGFSGQATGAIDRTVQVMRTLGQVSPDLMWEFGPSDRGHTLCITAEWRDALRPLARLVRAMAPDLPRWRSTDVRDPSSDDEDIEAKFEARFRQPLRLSRIELSRSETGRIDLVGHGMGTGEELIGQCLSVASLILGEAVERDWLGTIETTQDRAGLFGFLKRQRSRFDAQEFRDGFRDMIALCKTMMPDRPYADWAIDQRPTTLAQISGLDPMHRRSDLFLVNTSNQTHCQGMLAGGRFASPCYSRHGEWFLYLRIARTAEAPFDQVDDRYALEAALHEALASDGTGGWVAGGTGTDAVYIDLAVTHVGRALGRIADVVAQQPMAAHATVHFLDSGLEELVLPALASKQRLN